jgi:S1-C subfamily serine protease
MRIFVILSLLIAGCTTVVFQRDDASAFRRRVSKSVVRVVHADGSGGGSGFPLIIAGHKYIVSNAHVCGEEPYALQAYSDDTRELYPLNPVAVVESADLCISDVLGAEAIPPLKMADKNAAVGDTIYTLGFPLLRYLRLERGQVEMYLPSGVPPAFATNLFVLPGQSGSPVLNNNAEVVGVIFARDRDETHTAYAIPLHILRGLVNALEEQLQHPGDTADN